MTDDEQRDEVARLHDHAYNPDFVLDDTAALFWLKPLTPKAKAWIAQQLPGHTQMSSDGAFIIEEAARAETVVSALEAAGMWWMAKP